MSIRSTLRTRMAGLLVSALAVGRAYTAPRHVPIWVGTLRSPSAYTPGESDQLRTARHAMWHEARRKYPGISGRQFVKARKVAQRAVRA